MNPLTALSALSVFDAAVARDARRQQADADSNRRARQWIDDERARAQAAREARQAAKAARRRNR